MTMMKYNLVVAADSVEPPLMKKSEICREFNVSGPIFEKLVAAGKLPQPIFLGATLHSRRWYSSAIRRHLGNLATNARRPAPVLAHA
jgi:predicted DNA-binding transcriptional regulator AlpA